MLNPVMSEDMMNSLWDVCECICPFCGGIHVTVEELDVIGISVMTAMRCGTDFTVPRQDVMDTLHFQNLVQECPFELLNHLIMKAEDVVWDTYRHGDQVALHDEMASIRDLHRRVRLLLPKNECRCSPDE